MGKIYISGKITGLPIEMAKIMFDGAEKFLESNGKTVVNPFKIQPENTQGWEWADFMACDLKELFYCDAIYMMKNWGQSKGARIEYAIAREMGIDVIFEE